MQICYIRRRGSHYGRFCWGLFTQGIKICQHTNFLMWPNVCVFKKIKIWENHQRGPCAWVGLADFVDFFFLNKGNRIRCSQKLSFCARVWRKGQKRFLTDCQRAIRAKDERRQQKRAAQDWAVGRKILDRASKWKSVTSCYVDSPESKWCDKLYLTHMCSFLGGTRMWYAFIVYSPISGSGSHGKWKLDALY